MKTYPPPAPSWDRMAELLRHGAPAPQRPARLTTPVEALFSRESVLLHGWSRPSTISGRETSSRWCCPTGWRRGLRGPLLDVYRYPAHHQSLPYLFYFTSDDMELAGASPETLVKLADGVLHTFPLAGTRPRGKTAEEDKRLEEETPVGRKGVGRTQHAGGPGAERHWEDQPLRLRTGGEVPVH